jgi:iron complex outermembrane recepter protein
MSKMQKNIPLIVFLVFANIAAQAQTPSQSQPADTQDQQIQEILVTAQRRSERLQDVPISVNAFDAATMKALGITSTEDLGELTPGLVVSRESTSAVFTLRGIRNENASILGDEQAVSLYVDGVYLPSSQAAVFDFNNIDRIEVLEGPQGTLFGRNATGGVIQIITKTPSQTPHADFDVSYANYNTVTSNLYATGGVTKNLAADISIHYENQGDGWGKNLFNGEDAFKGHDFGVRSKWLLTLDDTSVTLSGDYNKYLSDVGTAYYLYPGFTGVNGHVGRPGGFYDVDLNFPSFSDNETYGGSITVDQNFHWATFKSISAFHRVQAVNDLDQDGTPLPFSNFVGNENEHTFTQELQLASPAGSAVRWLTGLYYYNDRAGYYPAQLTGTSYGGLSLDINSIETAVSYAGFGQATVTVLPATDLTLGVRYTSDHRHIVGQIDTSVPGLVLSPGNQEKTFDKTTFRISLDHHFTDDILSYISYNRGFKSGVFNTFSPNAPAVEPEVLNATEIGLKTEFFDKRLRFNSAAYYYQFSNMQLAQVVSGQAFTVNAASADIKGVDGNLEWIPLHNLTFRAGGSYIHSKFTNYPNAPFYVPAAGGGLATVTGDATGNQLPYAPKYSFNVGGDYAVPTEHGTYTFNINEAYTDSLFINADNQVKQPSFGYLNSSLSWASPDRKWDVRVWGKNLTDVQTYTYLLMQASIGVTASPAAPRTFGITLGTHW